MADARYDVVQLVTRLNIGGIARHVLLLTRELAASHKILLAAGRPSASEGELTDDRVPVRHVPLVRPIQPAADGKSLLATRRLLLDTRPRILHTHMAKAGSVGRAAALSLKQPRPKLVHTFHGHVFEGYFGRTAQRAIIETERALARRTDVLLAVSPEIRDELLALRIGRPSQHHVISLGLDLDAFAARHEPSGELRAHLGLEKDTPLVGVVGRLVKIKAIETLISAVGRLPGAHLAVVGDGDDRARLETWAATEGVRDRVHFTGWWPNVAAAMSDLDVVAISSKNEGTPVSLIEALAAARPVVATDVGGVRHVVHAGINGLVVPPSDPAALADALAALLADPDLRRRFGQAGRAHALGQFGSARMVAEMTQLYDDLGASNGPH